MDVCAGDDEPERQESKNTQNGREERKSSFKKSTDTSDTTVNMLTASFQFQVRFNETIKWIVLAAA